MLEIPGEEAPTDPGLQARQRKEVEDRARAKAQRSRQRVFTAVGVCALLLLGVGGAYSYQAQQAALTYEMDDYYLVPLDQLQAVPQPGPEVAPPEQAPGVKAPPAGTPRRPAVTAGQATPGPEGTPADPPIKRAPYTGPLPDAAGPGAVGTLSDRTGGTGTTGIVVERISNDRVLTDDQEIYDMAKRVVNASSPQLQTCYNQRLKLVEGLKGAWEVSFTIGTDGVSKNVRVSGVNSSDAELEACLQRSVAGWKFQKIVKDQPIRKTYRFGAGGW